MEFFDLLGKYMDEYVLDVTWKFNADNSSSSTVKNVRKHWIVQTNKKVCTTQGELFLESVLTGHDPLQWPRE
jgi:hypothetical protein